MHGVELFRLQFIRDAMDAGVDVTIVHERSWASIFPQFFGKRTPRLISVPYILRRGPTGFVGALLASRTRADVLLLGDPNNGLIPAIRLLLRSRAADRVLVSAEGEGRERLIKSLPDTPMVVIANNDVVAAPWKARPRTEVHVCYGVADAHLFFPRPASSPPKATIDFVLLAKLPSKFKGVEVAVAAFEALPADVRERARLHLAGYISDPPPVPPGVVCHRWIANADVGVFFREMDVQLVPSLWESFSQSTVQGMLSGLPLVTSDIPTLREKVETGGGYVCQTHEDYVEAMTTLARDAGQRRRMGEVARRTALDRYVLDTGVYLERYFFPKDGRGGEAGVQVRTPARAAAAE